MSDYIVRDLLSGTEVSRPWILINKSCRAQWDIPHQRRDAVEEFHRKLPDYSQTQLHSLPKIAAELGLSHVFVKDESTRFGLPSFKILGASWAIYRALCKRLDLTLTSSFGTVKDACRAAKLSGNEIGLVTCTEGNWGRACARMATIFGITARVYVPSVVSPYVQDLLRRDGVDLKSMDRASYGDALAAAKLDAEKSGALMVADTSWDGYEEIPRWVTDGYATMLLETDRQIASLDPKLKPNTFVASVGVGSWAHAVLTHYKAVDPHNRIISVEPDVAACLKESLHRGELTSIETGPSIMAGICCGTPSKIAWAELRDGIYAATTVTDREAHHAVVRLRREGVNAGPTGAATLATLEKYAATLDAEERRHAVVVLFSTEGSREYEIPG